MASYSGEAKQKGEPKKAGGGQHKRGPYHEKPSSR
eukprot:CAMPEP_0195035284 /NCGR_PEP_ID=MMETSP0326_2-20130528/69816_1 /TAXON_ID=2866 ORGANISM="Crypthecodinium cohnii, Strain Seligo" /NCGR_SAMPLE_ID=MMETSP0326_2 /ASSEMBLY_ACC=CAM_ASM_000348 /LENGTH=34 /DNA_ID= /DNA_START= /DNA_END= /DNA_ORIENTATION=